MFLSMHRTGRIQWTMSLVKLKFQLASQQLGIAFMTTGVCHRILKELASVVSDAIGNAEQYWRVLEVFQCLIGAWRNLRWL